MDYNLFKSIFLNKKNLNNSYFIKKIDSKYSIKLVCKRYINIEEEEKFLNIENNFYLNNNNSNDFYMYIFSTNITNNINNNDNINIKHIKNIKKIVNKLNLKNNIYSKTELIDKINTLNSSNINIIIWFLDSYRQYKFVTIYTNMSMYSYSKLFINLNTNNKHKILNYSQIPNSIENFLNILNKIQ